MFNRKIAAYIVVLAIVGVSNSIGLLKERRRIAALESRMDEVESDVNATVAVERMRTVLPFPGDHHAAAAGDREQTCQG